MTKLKDDKTCQCSTYSDADPVRRLCWRGYCTEFLCPSCGMIRFDAGPVFCPHKRYRLRPLRYPDMDVKHHPPVKESIMRKRSGSGGNRRQKSTLTPR